MISHKEEKEEKARGRKGQERKREGAQERGYRQRGRGEREGGGQHFHVPIPPLAKHLLFGFFHLTALQWLRCTQRQHSAHKPMGCLFLDTSW